MKSSDIGRRRERRQLTLNLGAMRFEPRRQDQQLAEMRGILVRGEARTVGRDLEQDAARLLEVHRLEPEAIDHLGRVAAGRDDLLPHDVLMLRVVDAPGEVMDAADAPGAPRADRYLAHIDDAGDVGEAVARPAVLFAEAREAERAGEKRDRRLGVALPDLCAVEAADLPFHRNRTAVPRRELATR